MLWSRKHFRTRKVVSIKKVEIILKRKKDLILNLLSKKTPPKGTAEFKRKVSFAARFAGMKGPMKDDKGRPTRKALALRAWGFRNEESARNFANKHKAKV